MRFNRATLFISKLWHICNWVLSYRQLSKKVFYSFIRRQRGDRVGSRSGTRRRDDALYERSC